MERWPTSFIDPQTAQEGLMPALNNLPEGHILLVSDQTEDISSVAQEVTFAERPDYEQGREHSMHEVHFADMSAIGKDDSTLSVQPVAIKPYPKSWPWLAEHDYVISKKLNDQHNRQIAYSTIGFTRWHGVVSSLTQFEQGVTSCDNLLWKGEKHPTTPEDIRLALGVAAQTLVFLHDLGMVHGDFAVRNTAYDSTMQFRVIDVTTTHPDKTPDEFCSDISAYIESISDHTWGNSAVNNQQIAELFLAPYRKTAPDILPKSARLDITRYVDALMRHYDK